MERYTRRSLMTSATAVGVIGTSGCLGVISSGNRYRQWRTAPVGSLSGTWPCLGAGFHRQSSVSDVDIPNPQNTFEFLTETPVTENAQPAVVNETVYVPVGTRAGSEDSGLAAIDLETGRRRWFTETPPITTTPVVVGEVVICSGHRTIALNRHDGSKYWENQSGYARRNQSPIVVEDTVITPEGHVLDLMTGRSLGGNQFVPKGEIGNKTGASQVATDGTRTIHTYQGADGGVRAYDAKHGNTQWALDTGSVTATPLVAEDRVSFVVSDYILASINMENGGVEWKKTAVRSSYGSRPALIDGILVVFERENTLRGIDINTGTTQWTTGIPSLTPPVWLTGTRDSALVADKDGTFATIVVGTGMIQWSLELLPSENVYVGAQPVITDYGAIFPGTVSTDHESTAGLILYK